MDYSLETFCEDCRRALRDDPGQGGRERVRQLVERLIADRDFVAAHVGPQSPIGKRTLFEDPDLGFVVLAYNQDKPHRSPPHDHGPSWAVYGQVEAHTDMTEYRRSDPGAGAGHAELVPLKRYRLGPGQAGLYDGAEIHAIDYPAGARYVRVTGTDLDRVQRIRYDEGGKRAEIIASASAS
jgi:hypothetical protein